MKIRHYTQHHITLSLARSGALLMLLLLFSIGCLLPGEVNAAGITCSAGVSGCHFAPTTTPMIKDGTGRNTPSGRFTGSHARHSGYSTGSKRQYNYVCTKCHPSGAYNNSHQTGFKNITGSSLPGNRYSAGKKIANTNSPAFGNCGNIYCHSTGRASGMGQVQYSSAKWGGTKTCLGCHGGRNGANPARSVGNFTLTTSHSQHLKYPAANINCQLCHAKTATDAATLKSYTGVQHHINGVREVTFTNIAYGSYTSYKSSEAGSSGNTKTCSNTSCHGGKTRSSWSSTVQNTDHTCSHCHGTAGTSASTVVTGTSRYNLRFFAPGYKKPGTVGTSTDQIANSNNIRVGSHFKHLSSAYMKNIKCNECHKVPSTPFSADTNHTLNTLRYNSGTLDFGQSTSARILIGVGSAATPAQLSAFAGYTNGTGVKAATCSSVYCHGNRLKNGPAGGTYTKPYWNYSAMINYTDKANACAKCHGNPPSSVTGSHNGKAATTSCVTCHNMVVDAGGNIINKALHINGRVESAGGDCIGCHGTSTQGARRAVNADFTGKSHHVTSGTLTKWHCILCHAEGDTSTGDTTTVHANNAVDLRNVDSPGNPGTAGTNYWAIPVTKAAADYTNIDNFCFKCHDVVGSAGIAINASAALITTGLTATNQQKPFNDNLTNSYDQIARTRVVDVDTQFTATNYSHHAVKAAKYTAAGGLPFNTAAILHGGNVDDNSRLHCHDCHRYNGHGTANNEYMLQNSTGADTLHTATTYVCFKCHASGTYSSDHTGKGNGSDFSHTAGQTGLAARIANDGNVTGISCTACHNVGGTGWGGIHGGNYTYTQGGGGTQSTYRFMPGMNNNGYTTANWTAATSAVSCYTNPNASWGGCTSHTGGKPVTLTRPAGARALSY